MHTSSSSSGSTSPILSIHLNEHLPALSSHQTLHCPSPKNVKNVRFQPRPMKRVFFLDVHPLCYDGNKPKPLAFVEWMRLIFSGVLHEDPVVAVLDGERGNDYRRQLLPTYKAKRNKYMPLPISHGFNDLGLHEALPHICSFLQECGIPVVKVADAEADDVVATLAQQAIDKGLKVVIASPDMDFRQLLSQSLQLVLPLKEGRWSFYTLERYVDQHKCEPHIELGLRCLLGDSTDCVPGLADFEPGFGRKTSLKLMKKHGSLEALMKAAAVRTVGRPYVQDTLKKHAATLEVNYKVLSLRRDIKINFEDGWCMERDTSKDFLALDRLKKILTTA